MSICSSAAAARVLDGEAAGEERALGVLAAVDGGRRADRRRRAPAAVGARHAAERLLRHGLRHLQPVGDQLDQVVLQRPGIELRDHGSDRPQRVLPPVGRVEAGRLERPLDLEARHRDRRLQQRAHRLRPLALHDVRRILAGREPDHAQVEPAQVMALVEHPDRVLALRDRLLTRGVRVLAEQHLRRQPLERVELAVGQRRPHRAHRLGDPGLAQRDHVRVALHEHEPSRARRGGPGEVGAVDQAALVEELGLRRVEVLRLVVRGERPRAEPEHVPLGIGEREHDPPAEPVEQPAAVAPARRQPRGRAARPRCSRPAARRRSRGPKRSARSRRGTRAARPPAGPARRGTRARARPRPTPTARARSTPPCAPAARAAARAGRAARPRAGPRPPARARSRRARRASRARPRSRAPRSPSRT